MTIITQGNSDSVRRCDATCHNAKPGTRCTCICGGRYHASGGSQRAQERLTEDMLGAGNFNCGRRSKRFGAKF